MLTTVAVVLVALWFFGLVTSHTLGGFPATPFRIEIAYTIDNLSAADAGGSETIGGSFNMIATTSAQGCVRDGHDRRSLDAGRAVGEDKAGSSPSRGSTPRRPETSVPIAWTSTAPPCRLPSPA